MTCSFDPKTLDEKSDPIKCPICNNWIIPGCEHPRYFDHDAEVELVNRINEFWGDNYQQPEELTRKDLLYFLSELFFDRDITIEYYKEILKSNKI
jgi:hypothetical protein